MKTRDFLLLVLLSTPVVAVSDSMRCGKWVVNETASPAELLEKCGQPLSEEISREDVLGKNALGNPIKLGVKVTKRWRYQRSPGSLPMLVTIVDDKVKSIERAQ